MLQLRPVQWATTNIRNRSTAGPLWFNSVAFSSSVSRPIRSSTRVCSGKAGSRNFNGSSATAAVAADRHNTRNSGSGFSHGTLYSCTGRSAFEQAARWD